jgi:drug/metabolite transporter (DMT)-like permease
MSFVITVVAALLLGTGFVLQQYAAQQAPDALFLRIALIKDLLKRRRWLAGLAVMIAGYLASAYAVSHLALSLAEPILATNLLFALALAVPLSGQRLRASELAGAVILACGVAALSVARTAKAPAESFASPSGWLAAAGIAAVAVCFVYGGVRRSGTARAVLTGTAAGLVIGISDALTRDTVQLMDTHGFSALLVTWPAYSVVAASIVGVWLTQSAFSAAALHASLPGISAAEPVAGILLGVLVFGDSIRTSPGMIALQAAGLALLISGVVLVARAPALAQLNPKPGLAALAHTAQTARQRASHIENAPNVTSPSATEASNQGPGGV